MLPLLYNFFLYYANQDFIFKGLDFSFFTRKSDSNVLQHCSMLSGNLNFWIEEYHLYKYGGRKDVFLQLYKNQVV